MVKIYMPISQVITGLLLLGFAVTSDVTQFAGPFSTALVETLAYTTSLILLIWGVMWFFWAISRDKGVMSLSDRRDQFELDAIRKNRPHRDDELARLKELDSKYSRYSILVKRDKKAIKLIAVEHKPASYRMPTPFLRYKSVTSKKLYNVDNESWDGKSAVKWKIDNPTVDKVMDAMADAQVAVEEMENNSYRNALEEHKVDVLAITMQPPPASASSRAHVAVNDDPLQGLIDKLDDELKVE